MSNRSESETLYDLLALALAVPLAGWSGFVIATMWGWFVVPLGVPSITLWHGAGLMSTVGWVASGFSIRVQVTEHIHAGLGGRKPDRPSAKARLLSGLSVGGILPAIILGFGWLYHALM